MKTEYMKLTQRLVGLFVDLPQVEAITLGGSLIGEQVDSDSDIDLYVYTSEDIPLEKRVEIMECSGGARRASMGFNFWGPGDEWFNAQTGIEVDIVYFDFQWMEDQIRRVVLDHQPSMGYSTCFWYTVRHSRVFYDPNAWFTGLEEFCQRPYPEPLRQNIIAHNHPVLREIVPSYFCQLEKAVKRNDKVSINHRLTGLLASYFDTIFALNYELHPGEKRLVEKTLYHCKKLPVDMAEEIEMILVLSASADSHFLNCVTTFLNHLDDLIADEGFSL